MNYIEILCIIYNLHTISRCSAHVVYRCVPHVHVCIPHIYTLQRYMYTIVGVLCLVMHY